MPDTPDYQMRKLSDLCLISGIANMYVPTLSLPIHSNRALIACSISLGWGTLVVVAMVRQIRRQPGARSTLPYFSVVFFLLTLTLSLMVISTWCRENLM